MKKSNTVDAMEDLQSKHMAYQLFEKYIEKELCIKLTTHDDYRFIIGESPYPNATNVILPFPSGIYQTEGIPEVAFLSSNWTIDVILVFGILFGSIDKSTQFLDWLFKQSINQIALLGEFLFEKCKIPCVNFCKLYFLSVAISIFWTNLSNIYIKKKKTTHTNTYKFYIYKKNVSTKILPFKQIGLNLRD